MPGTAALHARIESRTVVDDGWHNGFTDLVAWQGQLWLAYRASPTHFASKRSRIVLLHSPDAQTWQQAARFDGAGKDIRDPKLAVIDGRLTLFALLNQSFDPRPYQTVFSSSEDGQGWEALAPAAPGGWLLGKPKCAPDGDWYTPGHNLIQGTAGLFRLGEDGRWQSHASLTQRQGADETAIEFTQDGSLLAVTRLEAGSGLFGSAQAGTLSLMAQPPYQSWGSGNVCHLTRLDGPCLFTYKEQIHSGGAISASTLAGGLASPARYGRASALPSSAPTKAGWNGWRTCPAPGIRPTPARLTGMGKC